MHEIRIPRLGWSMEEGTFIGWLKQSGDQVAVGEPLFELEGEKAQQEIESVNAGTLHIPPDAPQPGAVIPVGALLGYLLAAGESVPDAKAVGHSVDQGDHQQQVAAAVQQPDSSPTAHRPTSAPVSSMRARRVAAELGIDWTTLPGTGRDGRIREADVRAAQTDLPPSPANVAAHSAALPVGMSSRRHAIAERLRISRDRTIPVTLISTADATNLVALREQFKSAKARIVPAYTDILACLVATVMKRHPQIAVRWNPLDQSLVQIAADQFNIGIAVDSADGLVVPIVRDVPGKSLLGVAQESKTLIDRARSGRLTAAEMQDGVMTISNLGAFGIDAFTPIINYPEIAILGVGALRREAVVLADDRIVPQDRITLSLTFDHAAIDGAPAAAFLRDIVSAVENPAAHLLNS